MDLRQFYKLMGRLKPNPKDKANFKMWLDYIGRWLSSDGELTPMMAATITLRFSEYHLANADMSGIVAPRRLHKDQKTKFRNAVLRDHRLAFVLQHGSKHPDFEWLRQKLARKTANEQRPNSEETATKQREISDQTARHQREQFEISQTIQ